MRNHFALIAAIGLGLVGSAKAGLLTYEGVDYPVAENLTEKSGGTGWDANWGAFLGGANNLIVAEGSLSDPTNILMTSGHHVASSGGFAGRYNLYPNYGSDGSTSYFSFLLRPDSTPDTDDFVGLQLFSRNSDDLFVGKGGTSMKYRLESRFGGGLSSESAVDAEKGKAVLLVIRIDFNVSGNDETFRLYVNPVPGAPEPAVADATLSYNLGAQNGLGVNSGNGALASYDEFRIGTDFASVVPAAILIPEPAAMGVLLGTAGLAMTRRRR